MDSKISLTIIFLSTWFQFGLRRCWPGIEIGLSWHGSGTVACPHRVRLPWAVVPKALPTISPLLSLPQPLLASADSEFQRKRHRLTISVSCLCNSVRGRPPPPVVFAGNAGGLKHRSTPSPVSSQCFDLRQPATLCLTVRHLAGSPSCMPCTPYLCQKGTNCHTGALRAQQRLRASLHAV